MVNDHYDVIIAGGGFGGMCAAARLVNKGYTTLLVERLSYLGGRASSIDYEGFQLSTGAIAIPGGDIIEETYKEVGAAFNVRKIDQEMVFRIKGHDYDDWSVSEGLLNSMCEYAQDKEGALKVIDAIDRAAAWQFPFGTTSLKSWLTQYTDDERIFAAFQPFSIVLLGTNIHELPVSEFFAWMAQNRENEGLHMTYAHEGNAALLEPLERVIVEKGGKVLKNTQISEIVVDQYMITGVKLETDDGEREISAKAVISNMGPKKTVEISGDMNFDIAYLAEVEKIKSTPLVVIVNVVSDEPFFEHHGFVWPLGSPPLVCLVAPTNCCPELAPRGKHILQSYSGMMEPESEIDVKREIASNREALYKLIPEARVKGEVLSVGCWQKDWPLFHSTWYGIPTKTSVVNLYNVGDGIKIPGLIGVSLCAETARIVAEEIMTSFDPGQ